MNGMSLIVKRVTRYTVGLILLFGLYIVLHGHLTPGGGFAGGVIVALSFIHLVLAFGGEKAKEHLPGKLIAVGESVGGLLLLGIALIGLVFGFFFLNFFPSKGEPFRILSAGIIPLCNIAIGFKVATGLFAIFMTLALFKFAKGEES